MQGTILDQLKYRYKYGGAYMKLIFWNAGIYLFFGIIEVFAHLFRFKIDYQAFMLKYLYANTVFGEMIYKPWTLISYMFLHGDILHLLFNMLWLYLAGRFLESSIGSRRFTFVYFLSGIVGYLVHYLAHNTPVYEHSHGAILGASAAVAGVFIALVTLSPNIVVRPFGLFNIRLLWLGIIFIGMDLINLTANDGTAHFAHLGGALAGFLYATAYLKGTDLSKWFKFRNPLKRKPRFKVVPNEEAVKKGDHTYNQNKAERQRKIDGILDKIKESGYDSLTKAEKEFLFKESKNM